MTGSAAHPNGRDLRRLPPAGDPDDPCRLPQDVRGAFESTPSCGSA